MSSCCSSSSPRPEQSDGSCCKEITPQELKQLTDANSEFVLIDVRETDEREVSNIGGVHIPLGEFEQRVSEIPDNQTVVIYCRSGGRSGKACEFLRQNRTNQTILNLAGGMKGWAKEIDPSIEVA